MSAPEIGDTIAVRTVAFHRADLLAYAAASGDGNLIHQDEAVARSVGLPGVIAHGMLTMGVAVQPVVDWIAELNAGITPPAEGAHITEYGVRFTRPVVVDAEAPAEVTIEARVGARDAAAVTARIDLTVSAAGQTVLGKAQVQLAGLPTESP